jgi:hypothetical protein
MERDSICLVQLQLVWSLWLFAGTGAEWEADNSRAILTHDGLKAVLSV